jgi:iron-sulfur cluster assembly protein
MLMLTKSAADVIRELGGTPGVAGVRISGLQESPTGLQATLVPEAEPLDEVVEAEGARIFLAPDAAEAVDDKVLDADLEQGGIRFALLEQEDT